jgi:hypothetical protein
LWLARSTSWTGLRGTLNSQLPTSNFSISQPDPRLSDHISIHLHLHSTLAKQTCTFSNNLRISFRLRVSESSFLSHVQSPTFRMVRIHPIGNLKSCPVPPSMCGRVASLIFGLSESERYTCKCQVISLASETFVPCCPLLRRCRGSERVRDPSSAKRCIFEGFLLLSSLCGHVACIHHGNCHTLGVLLALT